MLSCSIGYDGYARVEVASYRILLFVWIIYCFLVTKSFSGCILAFMNVRIHDEGVHTVSGLEHALVNGRTTGGTLAKSAWLAMIEVSDASRC